MNHELAKQRIAKATNCEVYLYVSKILASFGVYFVVLVVHYSKPNDPRPIISHVAYPSMSVSYPYVHRQDKSIPYNYKITSMYFHEYFTFCK